MVEEGGGIKLGTPRPRGGGESELAGVEVEGGREGGLGI